MILLETCYPRKQRSKNIFLIKINKLRLFLCQCIQQLHTAKIPKQPHFFHLKELLTILDNDLAIPLDILSKARQMRDDLLMSTNRAVLLHGDLHHENILKNGESWLVIDPKGFIGDRVFEVCAFIHNPSPALLEQASPIKIINDRIQACADLLGFPKQRIQDWLYVKSVSMLGMVLG